MSTTPRRARTAAVATALALALVAGCSGDDEAGPAPEPEGSSAPAVPEAGPLTTTATIGQLAGGPLAKKRRQALLGEVTPIVDAWIDGAYVGGAWPRADVGDAFSGFSTGARKAARRDLDVLSNTDVGERLTAVTATTRRLYLDVLAVKRRAAAVTARVWLRFDAVGEITRSETVKGRLFLTRSGSGWEVFGYDVSAGDKSASTTDEQKGENR